VTWVQMTLTKGAATGPHHSILLWPVPVLLMAAVFASELSRLPISALCSDGHFSRPGAAALTCAAAIPPKLVVLTFDDAVKSHRTFVAPLLKELGFGLPQPAVAKLFSGGMKRRLEIARGFLHTPKILFWMSRHWAWIRMVQRYVPEFEKPWSRYARTVGDSCLVTRPIQR
jgi:hypothetical protein